MSQSHVCQPELMLRVRIAAKTILNMCRVCIIDVSTLSLVLQAITYSQCQGPMAPHPLAQHAASHPVFWHKQELPLLLPQTHLIVAVGAFSKAVRMRLVALQAVQAGARQPPHYLHPIHQLQ